ncbi:MAG: PLP-dependent aminotransferase family protein [Ruminococcaceae bacterium]|nr:PLP-dependent aminotransferase family protein [Oscillospiraceae bacterium]
MNTLTVTLDPNSRTPLYLQLHDHLAREIASGAIREGERLPGKRTAAKLLGVSLSTVDGAYQLLASEGYVTARPRSGFVACRIEQLPQASPPPPAQPEARGAPDPVCSFLTGGIDGSLFPFRTWARLFKETLYTRPDLLNHGEPRGDLDLRQAIATYLYRSRGVLCRPDQILVGAGMEYLLGLLCRLLAGRCVAVEEPGYPKTRQILSAGGLRTVCVPLDEQGVSPAALNASQADAAYLTPSHQFPTGLVTPAGRRSALLKWASEGDRFLIEDDYDSEFRYDGRPMPCMQALAPERVIYVGTFSRTVAPAIRVAYLVLPPALLARYERDFGFYSSTVSRFEQHTLFRYLDEGHFDRSLSRARNLCRARRDLLVAALRETFGPGCRLENVHTGLGFLFLPETSLSEREITARAAARGLAVRGLDSYRAVPRPDLSPALVLGFSSLDKNSIPTAVGMLKDVLKP